MSEDLVSPNPRLDKKSSIKKSNKPDQSKSRKKPIEAVDDIKLTNEQQALQTTVEEKPDTRLQSKSSKREALQNKGESQFKENLKQAQKSEMSAKAMKSTDKASTIKEHHNHIESNQREFSLTKDPEEPLQVSKKKMATESKKGKMQETDTKYPKTEEKALPKVDEHPKQEPSKDEAQEVVVAANGQEEGEKPQKKEETVAEVKPATQENHEVKGKVNNSKKGVSITKPDIMSKKRNEVSKGTSDVDEHQDGKKSKSVIKKGSKSAVKDKSKDSKVALAQGKSGVKKLKKVEEKHP